MSSIQIIAQSQMRDSRETWPRLNQPRKIIVRSAFHHNFPPQPSRGLMTIGGKTLNCILGRGGIKAVKREGDGATPLTELTLMSGFYRTDKWPMALRASWMMPLPEQVGWCDEPKSANYNQAVKLPFARSHEKLMRDDRLYDCVLILDWNMSRRARNRGSAIFMHLTSLDKKPTEGCIALEPKDMRYVLSQVKLGDIFSVQI